MTDSANSNFKAIANPYIVGNPIEDRRMFFGREDDFAYIKKKVTGGKKGGLIVLCGTRRSGKTSILFQIKGGRLGEEFIPVLIDMQSMTVQSDCEFITKLGIAIVAAIGDPDVSLERDFCVEVKDNPFSAFQDLVKKISPKLNGKKLILLFDEYELFETHIDKERFSTDILNLLANWMEHKAGVFIVFTGSDKLESRNSRYWEYFLGKALHRRISFLSKTDTLRLINEPVSGVVHYDEGVAEEIFNLTAGQPFYTQVVCQNMMDRLNEVQRKRVRQEDVDAVAQELADNPLPQMIYFWDGLEPEQRSALSFLGEVLEDSSRYASAEVLVNFARDQNLRLELQLSELEQVLDELFVREVLERERAGEGQYEYRFRADLFRLWARQAHSVWQAT